MSKEIYHVAITPECRSYQINKSNAHEVSKRMHQDGVLTIQLVPALNEENPSENQIQLKPKESHRKSKRLWDLFK